MCCFTNGQWNKEVGAHLKPECDEFRGDWRAVDFTVVPRVVEACVVVGVEVREHEDVLLSLNFRT